jgi:hypothetical protein
MQKTITSFSRRAAFLCLALMVFNLHTPTVLGADSKTEIPPAGELSLAGHVTVDEALAVSGQTFFSGSAINVGARSRSTLTLGNHARLELSAETALKLDFSNEQMSVTLKVGRVRLFSPVGVSARLMSAETSVLADSRQLALFVVETGRDGGTTVAVEAGKVEISFADRTQLVTAGQSLSTSRGSSTLSLVRQHPSGIKGDGLLSGIGGMLSTLALVLARSGNEGKPPEDFSFGGTVTVASPYDFWFFYIDPDPDPCAAGGCIEGDGK